MQAELRANAGLLFAGLATFVLMGLAYSMYGPGLPVMGRAYGIGAREVGLILSVHSAGTAAGVGAMFLWGRSIGRRLATLPMVLGLGGLSLLAGLEVTLVAAALFGAGQGMASVIYNRDILAAFGARGASMLALLHALFGVGAIAGPLVFVGLGSDVRLGFGLVALLAAGVLLTAGRDAMPTVPVQPQPALQGFHLRPVILTFGALSIAVEACLFGLGTVALIAWGVAEVTAAGYLSAFFAAFLAARLAMVWLAAVISPFRIFAWSLIGAALFAALTGQGHIWAFVPLGACAALFFPGFYVTAARQMGDDPRVGPTIIAAGLIGGTLAPVAMGMLMAVAGGLVFFPVLAGVSAVTAILALALMRGMLRDAGPRIALAPAKPGQCL